MPSTLINGDGYTSLPGSPFASRAVVASRGMRIVRAALSTPTDLGAGYRLVEAYLACARRPITALCAIEIEMPAALDVGDFIAFNDDYLRRVESWGMLREGYSPIARTNVVPARHSSGSSSVVAFAYTSAADASIASDFVVSGTPEMPDGTYRLTDAVRSGDTSPEALGEKLECVVEVIQGRLSAVHRKWDADVDVHLYSRHDDSPALLADVLAARGVEASGRVTRHDAAPPVSGLEVEIGLRRCTEIRPDTQRLQNRTQR